jgi:hypothetical protein
VTHSSPPSLRGQLRNLDQHATDPMFARYVRDGELFVNNAVGTLL